MENCGIHASANIQILDTPPENSFFGLTTPNGVLHKFVYDYHGIIPDHGSDYVIQIRPFPDHGDDTLEVIKEKTVNKIIDTGLFSNCHYDPQNNYIWIDQKTVGTTGNTENVIGAGGTGGGGTGDGEINKILKLTHFNGGTNDPSNNPFVETSYQNSIEREFQTNFDRRKAKEHKELFVTQKRINEKRKRDKNCKPLNPQGSHANKNTGQRKIPCPTCNASNKVKDKIAGKNYFTIPFTDFRIPRFDHLIDKIPSFDDNRRDGEKCGACGGSKQITDVADDSAKYQQVAQKIESNAEKIMDKEAKLGLGGTRTTIIQGSDLLFVGLGFNNNKTYETIPGGTIAPSMKGGKIPQQNSVTANAVVGKQGSLAWPQQVGNYTIKCANKFSLLAGAGGITIATPGPLAFSSGIMKLTAPQISVGCSSGPLALEGESVNITGKSISITPTGGELFVKGNINNTGNILTQGHAHFESMSFSKAACVGVTKSTYTAKANPDVLQTQNATWSVKALAAALLDLKTYYQNVPADSKTSSFRLMSPKDLQNVSDRFKVMANLALPWEIVVTGYVIPGTQFIALINGYPCEITIVTPVDLHNFPHIHGIPEMMHRHEIMLPDMDYTNDSTQTLREKVVNGAQESGVPADPTKDTQTRLAEVKRTAVEFAAVAQVEATKIIAKIMRFFS